MLFVYFICFACIAGGAFALMWNNLQSLTYEYRTSPKSQHPEAPQPGDELMYVDLSRERLEEMYNEQNKV